MSNIDSEKAAEQDINESVSKEILHPTIDLSIDFAELDLDAFLTNDVLKEIPFVKGIVGFYKIFNSVRDRHNTMKLLTFFKAFRSKEIGEQKLEEFNSKFKTDSKYRTRVVELIILLNERFLYAEKSKYLANLIIAFIEGKISWEQLKELCEILDNFQLAGVEVLKTLFRGAHPGEQWGLILEGESLLFACGIGHRHGNKFSLTRSGRDFYYLGIRPALPNS